MALSRQFFRATRLFERSQTILATSKCLNRNYASESGELRLTLASPTDTFYKDEEVKQVDVPATNSNFGIVKQHVPVLAVMKPGLVVITEMDGQTKKIFVSSGSITVNDDSVVHILAEEAHPLERFDKNAAMDAITRFRQNPGTTPQERAETDIAVECLEELNRAL